jgi:hypothetical protein
LQNGEREGPRWDFVCSGPAGAGMKTCCGGPPSGTRTCDLGDRQCI